MRLKIYTPLLILLFVSSNIFSQFLETPRVSQHQIITQEIGVSQVVVDYHRPAVKGREIWGKLVPYGLTTFQFGNGNPAPWRAGADENTTISFSDDVKIEGKDLKAGKYGLFMIPELDEWTIIFSSNSTSWGSFFYDQADDVLRVKVKPQTTEFNEFLTYSFADLTNNSAVVNLKWEKMMIPFKIEFNTQELVVKSFENQLKNRAGFNWQGWQQAAFYTLQNNVSLDKGEEWINKSISMQENAANRNLLGYIYMAQKRTDEALKLFKENVEKYPDDWNVNDSLGEVYLNLGEKDQAKKWYKKALKMAPAGQHQRIQDILDKI